MEFTLRTIVVMILILIAALVFATLILGWGNQANEWFNAAFKPLRDLVLGE